MTEPTDVELDGAYRLGRIAGRLGREDCPFNANGTGRDRIMARRWVQGRLDAGGAAVATAGAADKVGRALEALGHDTHPGGEQFRHYWTETPEGLAKWADSPRPYTTLLAHLVKFMEPEMAKRVAAQWFHNVFHFWPGSDLNRVTHGQPPRGHNIGPG